METGSPALSTAPADGSRTTLTLYVFAGHLDIAGEGPVASTGAVLRAGEPVSISAGPEGAEGLILQGRPIGEPVAQYGPFVMNDRAGIEKAFADYRSTGFGGWPWPTDDPVHARDSGRFARHADGRYERREESVRIPVARPA
ncbi:MAG: hypothetical protein NVSMB4_12410 [Acidimicrobiales bacterium]